MKKFLVAAMFIAVLAISTASAGNVNFVLYGYVVEKVAFVETNNGYFVDSNSKDVTYGFYDLDSKSTDAFNAKVFTVVAT